MMKAKTSIPVRSRPRSGASRQS